MNNIEIQLLEKAEKKFPYRKREDFSSTELFCEHLDRVNAGRIGFIEGIKSQINYDEWISVTERYPPEKQKVLVFRPKEYSIENEYFITHYFFGAWHNGLMKITHWKPLTPPKS